MDLVLYKIIMLATKLVAVTEPIWAELSDLRRPGETFSQLMIKREKKTRLIEHLMHIADEGDD